MRNLILIVSLLAGLTACNEAKISAAVKVEEAVEKVLTTAFTGVVIEDHSCKSEVELIGDKVYTSVAKLLKIKEEAPVQGLLGGLAEPVCVFVGQKVLPDLIKGSVGSKYMCLKYIGAEGIKKVAFQLCSSL